jgi:hypothetical protein
MRTKRHLGACVAIASTAGLLKLMSDVPSSNLDCTCQVLFSLLGEMEYSVRNVGKNEPYPAEFRDMVANILDTEYREWATEPLIPREKFDEVARDICAAIIALNSSPSSSLDDHEFECLCQNEAGRVYRAHFP